ncbi:hypothetical protein RB195_013612 [Necator americanus]|uniref:Serpentine receptor class gamma n=1 Tax=Necator americanus TaxID=51031 RepID=A0ABR1DWC4_NECAM
MTTLLLIFNRFRAITFPFAKGLPYEVLLSIIAIFILPMPICYDLLYAKAFYLYSEPLQGYYLISETAHEHQRLLYLVIFECVVASMGLFMNSTGIAVLLRRSISQNRRKETRLFIISCICFLFQMLNAIVMLCIYLFSWCTHEIRMTMFLVPICNDLNSLSLPYYFLFFNDRMRKFFFDLPPCKWLSAFCYSEEQTKAVPLLEFRNIG